MKERMVEIATAAGRMEAFVTHPEEGGPFPAILVYMDVFGMREELFDVARRVATVGYYAMVPDFYYRNGRVRLCFSPRQAFVVPGRSGRRRGEGGARCRQGAV
jgi:dienelactone hydrolase